MPGDHVSIWSDSLQKYVPIYPWVSPLEKHFDLETVKSAKTLMTVQNYEFRAALCMKSLETVSKAKNIKMILLILLLSNMMMKSMTKIIFKTWYQYWNQKNLK